MYEDSHLEMAYEDRFAFEPDAEEPKPCRHRWVAGMMYVHVEDLAAVADARSKHVPPSSPIECEKCETVYQPGMEWDD